MATVLDHCEVLNPLLRPFPDTCSPDSKETSNRTPRVAGVLTTHCIVCALEYWRRVVRFWFGMVVCVAAVSMVKKRCQGEMTVR